MLAEPNQDFHHPWRNLECAFASRDTKRDLFL